MSKRMGITLSAAIATIISSPMVMAESGSSWQSTNVLEEVVVTARKRSESSLDVPVVLTAIGAGEIERRGVVNLDGIARIVPGLVIGNQGGSVQGGNISMRGISGPDSNPFGDEAVSFNIDGVQVAKGAVRRMSDIDIEQVEVLKGPQALFFGKNSPAGIVSIRTANPTDEFEAKVSVGYETEANEKRTEGYISGPLSETVGARFAGIYSEMDGWLDDVTPAGSVLATDESNNTASEDFAMRGTLTWDPSDDFSARLKLNYGETDNNGPQSAGSFIDCSMGFRQTGSAGPCGAGGKNVNAGSGPVVGTIPGTLNNFGDGQNFQEQKQFLGGLELNYDLSEDVTLTSVTGLYWMDLDQCQNYESDDSIALPSCNVLENKEISQELRVATDFEGPLNFTGGVYYAKTEAETGSITYLFGNGFDLLGPGLGGVNTPFMINNYFLEQEGTAYSAFFQVAYDITDTVEVTVGGRYSHEEKKLPLVQSGAALGTTILDSSTVLIPAVDEDEWNDFSPEVTLSYRPTDNLSLFASYKEGFLSGGFNSSSVDFSANPDLSYDPQLIDGFELGLKSRLFDGALLFNAAVYKYEVEDLQVTNFVNATASIRNAGAVEIEGAEFDVTFLTPIDGLTVHGAAAYNDGVYTSFPGAPCWNGQTPAQGCTIVNGNPTQNLDGTELIRAPKWNVVGGVNYEMPLGDSGLMLGLSTDFSHSSSYLTDASSAPQGRSPTYTLVDASIRIGAEDESWTLALIGRNLTDESYWLASPNVPFSGSGTGTAAGVAGDRFAALSRGREVMIRFTYMFGG